MDLSRLKKRPSYPFETVAVAVAFSPTLEAVLAETKRIIDAVQANCVIMHIGKRTYEKEEQLDRLMSALHFDKNKCRVIWMEGEPVDTILKLCKLNIVDLLILGALEKENLLKYYLGSVARSISRKAKCSVLLLTHPSVNPRKIKKVIVNGVEHPKTIHTVNTTVYLARHLKVDEIFVVKEIDLPTLAMTTAESSTAPELSKIKKELTQEENNSLHSIVEQCKTESVKVHEKVVHGKPGHAISKYARIKHADLLVINSPDSSLGILDRIFTHDIEYVLADLPCNLLIVHSRI